MKALRLLLCAWLAASLWGGARAEQGPRARDPVEDLVAELRSAIPETASFVPSADFVILMRRCAETKRLDCAYLLIKCLALSYDPGVADEKLSREGMLPAVRMMRVYFGDSLAPLLFSEGIQTKVPWLRSRIAFAAKKVCSPEVIQTMTLTFSLAESRSLSARDFLSLLSRKEEDIPLELDRPWAVQLQRIDDAVRRIKQER